MLNRTQALFKLFAAYFEFETDEDWLDVLSVSDTSSISRYRSGKRPLPERRIRELCDKSGISRSEFDLPIRQLAEKLEVTDAVPPEVFSADPAALPEDIEKAATIKAQMLVVFPGRDPNLNDETVIWFDRYLVEGSAGPGRRSVTQCRNTVLKEGFSGQIEAVRGLLSMQIFYPGLSYPPSHYLFQPIFQNRELEISAGIYTDVIGGPGSRIFSTQCCMINADTVGFEKRQLRETDDLFSEWTYALDNKVSYRGKLLTKSDPEDTEYIRSLVFKTLSS